MNSSVSPLRASSRDAQCRSGDNPHKHWRVTAVTGCHRFVDEKAKESRKMQAQTKQNWSFSRRQYRVEYTRLDMADPRGNQSRSSGSPKVSVVSSLKFVDLFA